MSDIQKADGIVDWLDKRLGVKTVFKVLASEYFVPKNINFLWAMGVVLLVLFTMLIISGLFLLMYYKPDINLAFDSVNKTIMNEVGYGWLWRHIHALSASLIFLVLYIHMFVAIYYGSYKRGREMIWLTGMGLFAIFSAEAFSGYMLPWGQMSYWAAKVITDLFAKMPVIGPDLVIWIRGNFTVSDSTLTRFFMLHVFLLPLVIMGLIMLHLYSLRIPHVNNRDGEKFDFEIESKKFLEGKKKESKVIPFWPAFISKDIFVICIFMIGFFYLLAFKFDFAMDPINFIPANHLQTPAHIYPEWYFLWSYEILRGFFMSETLGLIGFSQSMLMLFAIPFLDRSSVVAPAHRRPMFFIWFWILLIDMLVLTIFGKLPPTDGHNIVGFIAALTFFGLFVTLPIITIIEQRRLKRFK